MENLLRNSLIGIIGELTSDTLNFDRIDSLQYRVDWPYHTTVRYLDTGINDSRIVRCLREASEFLCGLRNGGLLTSCQTQRKKITGARGRPVFDIPKEQLEFLTEKRFTAKEMAQMFGVSKH